MTLLSALGGGLWIIPVGLFLASLWSFYRGYKQWKSGSKWWGKDERGVAKQFESDERVPYFSVGATIFGIILLVCAIGSYIWMQSEK
jgi:hypothetical protein